MRNPDPWDIEVSADFNTVDQWGGCPGIYVGPSPILWLSTDEHLESRNGKVLARDAEGNTCEAEVGTIQRLGEETYLVSLRLDTDTFQENKSL